MRGARCTKVWAGGGTLASLYAARAGSCGRVALSLAAEVLAFGCHILHPSVRIEGMKPLGCQAAR